MSTTTQSCAVLGRGSPLERVLFAIGGTLGLTSAALSALGGPMFTAVCGVGRVAVAAPGRAGDPEDRGPLGRGVDPAAARAGDTRAHRPRSWWLPKPLARILPKIGFGH